MRKRIESNSAMVKDWIAATCPASAHLQPGPGATLIPFMTQQLVAQPAVRIQTMIPINEVEMYYEAK
ncbi:MAG TPA: hypothetical protein GX506_04250 [Firmicutes bacterium]|nr:hypothetical protein [Bacillota bacterium]